MNIEARSDHETLLDAKFSVAILAVCPYTWNALKKIHCRRSHGTFLDRMTSTLFRPEAADFFSVQCEKILVGEKARLVTPVDG